jgi:hypothetical protein
LCTLQGVDFVVDGGERLADPSTVIDMTGLKPAVLRLGKVSASLLFAIMPLFRNIVIRSVDVTTAQVSVATGAH